MKSFHPYALFTVLVWSLAHVFTRLALSAFSPYSLGFLRYFFASFTLAALAPFVRIGRPRKGEIKWLLMAGASGFALYMLLYNRGLMTVSAAAGSVIVATVPVITALFAALIYKEKIRLFQWAAMVIEFAGVVILMLLDSRVSVNTGVIWLLIAAFFLSAYNIIQRRLIRTCTALCATSWSIFAGTAILSVFAPRAFVELAHAPPGQWINLLILGVFPSALGYVAWSKAFAKAKSTSSVSNYMFVTPLATSILGLVLAREIPDLPAIIGGSVIMAGMLLFNFGGRIFTGQAAKE